MRPAALFVFIAVFIFCPALPPQAHAEDECPAENTSCLLDALGEAAAGIQEDKWRDTTYRELAKLLAHENRMDDAIALIGKIGNPDTQAMTIRGIGMAVADIKPDKKAYDSIFAKLAEEAEKISHPPSHAIAQTYIAMSQAFAGDDEGAMKTAALMANSALRNKAYGETAEIQAERGDLAAVTASIAAVDDQDYRNKAWRTVSKIFVDREYADHALKSALHIDSAYQKSQALLYILSKKITPEEVSVE